MRHSHVRSIAVRTLRYSLCCLFFAGAQHPSIPLRTSAAPLADNQLTARAQSSSKQTPRSRSKKVANPLNELLEEARRDIERNDFQAAVEPLQKFLAGQPDFAYAHFQLGYAYAALQRWEEARGEFQRAIELDPRFSEAYSNLGVLLLERDPAAAVLPLRKAVELLPAQSRPRYLLGRALERSGDLAGALAAYESAERLDPRDLETALAHATALLTAHRVADAEAKFRAALALDERSAPARLGLARSLDAQQKSEAADAYRSYLELQPGDTEAPRAIARIAFREKQYDTALAALDQADGQQPPNLESLRLRADIQIAQTHWDEAITTLRRGLALAPKDAELQAGLGRVYLQKRDFPAAERELKAALRLDANYLPAWKDLSSTYYLSGDCAATLAVLEEVGKREAPGAGAWFVRAACYDKLRRPKDAMDAYQRFLALDHNEHPNQVWQAQQRIQVLRRTIEKTN